MRKFFAISSIAALLLLLIAAFINIRPEWKYYQRQYKKVAREKIKDEAILKIILDKDISLEQNYISSFGKVDRCVACHLGIENPFMSDAPQPFTAHPGNLLKIHPTEKYGCTVCHEGQGIATKTRDAHGIGVPYVERPMLTGPFVQSSCLKCHENLRDIGADVAARGEKIFREKGCQNCHKIKGVGGHLGPDLTLISDASIYLKHATEPNLHEYLKRFKGNYNTAFIYESVLLPKAQPPDSAMVDFHLTEAEAFPVTVYLKGMTKSNVPSSYIPVEAQKEETGRELFMEFCSVCHGRDGEGTKLPELGNKIGPAIGNQQFLAIADRAMLEYIITNSKGSGSMPAWGTAGGLDRERIEKIINYIKSLRVPSPTYQEIIEAGGNPQYGAELFMANCSGCHGFDGKHEIDLIGPTLNNAQLLSMSTPRFWYDTLTKGREGTAMPAWSFLGGEQLADIISYLNSWKAELYEAGKANGRGGAGTSVANGKEYFKMNCAGCHGINAEGKIGPSLKSPEFLRVASRGYLKKVITEGREETAMPAFSYLQPQVISDIVSYIKSFYAGPEKQLPYIKIRGSEYNGEKIYKRICAQCHGIRGQGGVGPGIGRNGFWKQTSEAFIKEMAIYGRSGTQMRANLVGKGGLVEISEIDIEDTIAYIRTFLDDEESLNPAFIDGDAQFGKERFERVCGQCHGRSGEGGIGPAIGKSGFLNSVTDGFIEAMAVRGRDGTEMRSFTGTSATGDELARLEEKELANIIAYLRRSAVLTDPKPKLLVGTPITGKMLFERNCAQCHGEEGRNSFAPELGNAKFLAAASDSYLQATMALGRHQTLMKPMIRGGSGVVELTSHEVNDIISYLRTLNK
ncbi:MAG: c-type cytochrome [Candidatus Schekmanbacteria bacterium]|nr:c-type cytochrome [Candidatus Schekmanbacteria bacterium]